MFKKKETKTKADELQSKLVKNLEERVNILSEAKEELNKLHQILDVLEKDAPPVVYQEDVAPTVDVRYDHIDHIKDKPKSDGTWTYDEYKKESFICAKCLKVMNYNERQNHFKKKTHKPIVSISVLKGKRGSASQKRVTTLLINNFGEV